MKDTHFLNQNIYGRPIFSKGCLVAGLTASNLAKSGGKKSGVNRIPIFLIEKFMGVLFILLRGLRPPEILHMCKTSGFRSSPLLNKKDTHFSN